MPSPRLAGIHNGRDGAPYHPSDALLAAAMGQYLRHFMLHRNFDRLMTTAVVAVFASSIALLVAVWLPRLVSIQVNEATASRTAGRPSRKRC